MKQKSEPFLSVKNLRVAFPGAPKPVVDDVSFALERGKTLGVIGESGSGKSLTGLAVLGMLPGRAATLPGTEIRFMGHDLRTHSFARWRTLRGREIGVVFQEPMSSLNPLMRVGEQVREAVVQNWDGGAMTGRAILKKTESLFDEVGLSASGSLLRAYPHEYSGGMQQRVMIAMALAGNPSLLVADEPTSALDVTSQEQVLRILAESRRRRNMAMLFISHDLDIVSSLADDVLVLHKGICEEYGAVAEVFSAPSAEYTKFLLKHRLAAGLPEISEAPHSPAATQIFAAPSAPLGARGADVVLRMRDVAIGYGGGVLTAPKTILRDINLELRRGKCAGIVGESGSGKSSLIKVITGMSKLLEGDIELFGKSMRRMRPAERRETSRRCQMISQNTHSALNPRLSVRTILEEPLKVNALPRGRERIRAMLEEVGLREAHADAYPHQLSGGQRQRVNIARALALDPEIVLCDEIVSALDVSVQSQILTLLKEIQKRRGMGIVFISHDLRVIRHMADEILMVKSGGMQIWESTASWHHTTMLSKAM